MQRHVQHVGGIVLVLIFLDIILVARGQLQPNFDGQLPRLGGQQNDPGPLNGNGPPLASSVLKNTDSGNGEQFLRNAFSKTRRYRDKYSDGICRDGWVAAKMNNAAVCISVNKDPLTWDEARDSCRDNFAFLLKLEAPVTVEQENIKDYLRKLSLDSLWTGLHEENHLLVWDELAPHKVRPYNDHLELKSVPDRIWDWDISDDINGTDVCGELDIKHYEADDESLVRKRRTPEEQPESGDMFPFTKSSKENENINAFLMNNMRGSELQLRNFQKGKNNNMIHFNPANIRQKSASENIALMPKTQASETLDRINQNTDPFGLQSEASENLRDMFSMLPSLSEAQEPSVTAEKIERIKNKKTRGLEDTINQFQQQLGIQPFENAREPGSTVTDALEQTQPSLAINPSESPLEASKTTLTSNLEPLLGLHEGDSGGPNLDYLRRNQEGQSSDGAGETNVTPLTEDLQRHFGILNENSDLGNSNIPSLEESQTQHGIGQQTENQGEAFLQMELPDLEKDLQLQQRKQPSHSNDNRKPIAEPIESSADMDKALESLQRQLGIRPSKTLNTRPTESKTLQQTGISNINKGERSLANLKMKENIDSIAELASLLTTNDQEETEQLPGIQPSVAPKDINHKAKSTSERTSEPADSILDKDNLDELKISPFNTPVATKTNMELTTINIDKPVAFTLFTTETPDNKESDNMLTISSPAALMQSEEDHSSRENITQNDDKSIRISSTLPAISPVVGVAITTAPSEYEKITDLLPDTYDGSNNDTTNSTDDLDIDDSIEDSGNPSIIGIVSTSTKQPDSGEDYTVVTTVASTSAETDSTLPPIIMQSTVSNRGFTPGFDSSNSSTTSGYKEEVEPADGEDDYYEEEEEEVGDDKKVKDKGKKINEIKEEIYDEKEESLYVSTPNVLGIISTKESIPAEFDDNSTELNDMEEELSESTRTKFDRNITFFSPEEYELSSNETLSDSYQDEDEITNYLDDDSYEISDNRTQTEETNEAVVSEINDEFDEINLGNSTDDYEEDLNIEVPPKKSNEAVVREKSNEFDEISIDDSIDDFKDDLDVEAASLFPESRTEDHELPDDDRQEFVLPANIKEHIQRSSLRPLETPQNTNVREVKAAMKLSECEIRRPSVCYSPAIIVDSQASTCPSGWHGHIFLDKCYKVIISAMPFADARLRCQREGGGLANMNSLFHERLVLMTIWKSQRDGLVVGTQSTFWVQKEASNGLCVALTVNGFLEVPCNTPAEVVCERPALQLNVRGSSSTSDGEDDKEDDDQDPEHITLSADSPNNTLNCGLTVTAKELPTVWFKDGQLVNIKLQQRSESLMSMLGVNGRPLSPLPEPALTKTTDLEMDTMLRKTLEYSTSHHLGSEMFQGTYWCEVWDIKPFKRRQSKPYEIRYSDVITFKGSVEVPNLSNEEALLHNMINKENANIKNVITDIKAIHEKIFPALRKNLPTLESASTYGGELNRNNPNILMYNAFLKMSDNYSTAEENMAYTLLHRQLRDVMGDTKFLLTLPGGTPLHVIRTIHIKSTVACPMTRLRDKLTGFTATFPRSSTDFVVNSVEICEGQVTGSAKCKGDYYTGAYWDEIKITKSCKKRPSVTPLPDENSEEDEEQEEEEHEEEQHQHETIETTEEEKEDDGSVFENMSAEDRLKELAEMEMEDNNVESIMEETADIVEQVNEITAVDVDYIADIMDKTVNIKKITREVGENILKTMDKVMKIDEDEIERANKETAATNRILKSFEKCAENIYMEDGNIRLVQPNVAMEVWKFNSMTAPIIGMAAKQGKGKDLTDIFREDRIYTIYNQSQLYDDIDAAIELPPELIKDTLKRSENDETRLYMMVYRDGRLFKGSTTSSEGNRVDSTFDSSLGRLNSYVISASIGGEKIQGLINKVKTVFRPLQDVAGEKRTCAFWDFTLNNQNGGWSSEGCVYDGQLNGRDICLCDHLTNFAVLIDFYGQAEPIPDHHEFSLSIISLVGLSLSILGLSLTIISYVFFKKLRQGRAQQTLFNLALAMLCSWVVFLTGIRQTHSYVGCILVAVLLHYFILASFMWMLMEAFLQYLTFVKVLGTYVTRYTLKTVIVAWGLPLIPIIVVLSVDHTLYKGGNRYCWMSLPAFYYAFAAPIGLIILCNLAVFVITVFSICNRPNGLRSNQSKQKIALTNLQAAITSFVLLGLTWLLGYLAISDARLVFQYAFTILNTLQGFFIFILFVARKKQVRDQWLIACCCKTPKQEKASRSLSASASIPSTCSGRSSYSGRSERSDSTKTTTSFMNDYDSIYTLPYTRHSRESIFYRKDGYKY